MLVVGGMKKHSILYNSDHVYYYPFASWHQHPQEACFLPTSTWRLAENADSQPLPQINLIRPSSLARCPGDMYTHQRSRISVIDNIRLCLLSVCIHFTPNHHQDRNIPLSFMSLSSALLCGKHLSILQNKSTGVLSLFILVLSKRNFCNDGSVLCVLCSILSSYQPHVDMGL